MSAASSHLLTAFLLCSLFACLSLCHAQDSSLATVPVITAISGCPGQNGPATFNCQFRGNWFVLTINGTGLDWTRQIVNVSGGICTPTGGTDTVMQCQLYNPADYPWPADTPLPVTVFDLISGVSSAPVSLITFIAYPPLTLTSASGCDSNGSASTYNCSTDSSIITLTGSGFAPLPSGSMQLSWIVVPQQYQYTTGLTTFPIYSLNVVNDTTITFPLSDLNRGSLPNTGRLCVTLFRAYIVQPSSFVCLTFVPTASNSRPAPNITASQPVITGVSGCSSSANNITLGCSRRSYLTITGTGFPTLGVVVSVGGEGCGLMQQGQTSTNIECYLPRYWNGAHSLDLLPVVVMGLWNQVQSAPFYGVQLAPVIVPNLSSISGCQGSGLQTSNCQLQSGGQVDAITITGSGLSNAYGYADWQVWFGPYLQTSGYYFLYLPGQTDTSATIPLNASSTQLTGLQELAALDVANSSVYVLLTKDEVMSNALAISLAPIYLNISGLDGCSPVSGFLLEDCVPGDSYLRIFATNVYPPISITVADQLCTGLQVLPGFVQCLLAAPEGFLPEVPYNVIVTQGSNQYIVPSAVAFTSRPVILDITSSVCAPDYLSQQSPPQLNCMAGDTVVIIGSFVASPVSLAVLLTANQVTVACSSPVLLSVWALSCVLPVLNSTQAAALLGVSVAVQVVFNVSSASNLVSVGLYRTASSLGVTALSGCQQQDLQGRGVEGCVTGAVLTVRGQNFNATVAVEVYELASEQLYLCQLPTVQSAEQLTCRLPYIANLEEQSITLPIRVRLGASTSNWLLGVGYSSALPVPGSTCPSGSSSTSYLSAFIVCFVLSVVLSIAIIVVLTRAYVYGADRSTVGKSLRSRQGRAWTQHVDGAGEVSKTTGGVELL